VIYNAIAWPGISTAVTTCLLTALSTIGSSRQKQLLRITGAAVGGFLVGMGSQIFILPYLDSVAGFVVLFVAVTALSSWFMTSSPRLSYFGIQVALAFFLVNVSESKCRPHSPPPEIAWWVFCWVSSLCGWCLISYGGRPPRLR
jgi:multidrug resistance protein MdtO